MQSELFCCYADRSKARTTRGGTYIPVYTSRGVGRNCIDEGAGGPRSLCGGKSTLLLYHSTFEPACSSPDSKRMHGKINSKYSKPHTRGASIFPIASGREQQTGLQALPCHPSVPDP